MYLKEFIMTVIKLAQLNIRSIMRNYDELKIFINETKPDVIAIQETWIKVDDNAV